MSRLYIIMKHGVDSLTTGRAMAQAAHCHGHAEHEIECGFGDDTNILKDWRSWKNEAKGFGTTIVLANRKLPCWIWVSFEEIFDQLVALEEEHGVSGYFARRMTDPEYAICDGADVHVVSYEPAYWIFANDECMENEHFQEFIKQFPLYP